MRTEIPVESVERDRYGGRDREDNHPAFGTLVLSRASGSARSLFQSDLLHHRTVVLSIHRATRFRSLNQDSVHPGEELIEIEMSLAQWGAVVSSAGIGEGTPVTIRRTEDERLVPGIAYEPRIAESIAETEAVTLRLLQDIDAAVKRLRAAFDEKQGVKAMREAIRHLETVVANAPKNASFAVESLTRTAEGIVGQARSDIENHILSARNAVGGTAPISMPVLEADTTDVDPGAEESQEPEESEEG